MLILLSTCVDSMTRLHLILCAILLAAIIISLNAPQSEKRLGATRFAVKRGVYDENRNTDRTQKQCPELKRLESLVNFFQETTDWAVLVEVGDMYHRGCFPFYGTAPETALTIYQMASRCPDRVVAARALSFFANTRTNPVSHRDSAGQPFPPEIATRLLGIAEHQIRTTPFDQFNNQLRVRQLKPVPSAVPVAAPKAQKAPVVAPLVLEKQNVHDHAVSQTTKKNVKHIVAADGGVGVFDRVELIDSVISELKEVKNFSDTKLGDSFRVLASLVPDKIESMGCSQLDVLNATFRKIRSVENQSLRANLIETLGNNLASGIEHDHVVCSTGKIARIVSTLEGTDLVENKSVPIEVIRREIGTLAFIVRADVLSEVADSDRNAYNSCTTVHALSDQMKERFRAQAHETYVVGLGLSPKVLWPLLEVYITEF